MLKPMDIHNKEFKKSMRGYDAEEVDEFLDEIIVDYEKMQREIDMLKTQLSNYSENMNNYREKEISLNNALVSAQRFADQLKQDAEGRAAEIIAQAEEEAGISTTQMASYLSQEEKKENKAKEHLAADTKAGLADTALSENEETKINVKLKEIMETANLK